MKAIEITDLHFSYTGEKQTLHIPALSIDRGEKVFLRGPSGSGKTTLLNLIGGILPVTKGKIEVLGRSLGEMPASQKDSFRADHLGFIFQTLHLISYLSPLENILLPLKFSKRKQDQVSEEKVQQLLQALRLNIEDMKNKKTFQLSVGQQQRVAVARALIGKPEIIIADEPTSSIDVDARDRFLKLLFEQAKEKAITILFVSHDPNLQTYFDRSLDLSILNRVKREEHEVF